MAVSRFSYCFLTFLCCVALAAVSFTCDTAGNTQSDSLGCSFGADSYPSWCPFANAALIPSFFLDHPKSELPYVSKMPTYCDDDSACHGTIAITSYECSSVQSSASSVVALLQPTGGIILVDYATELPFRYLSAVSGSPIDVFGVTLQQANNGQRGAILIQLTDSKMVVYAGFEASLDWVSSVSASTNCAFETVHLVAIADLGVAEGFLVTDCGCRYINISVQSDCIDFFVSASYTDRFLRLHDVAAQAVGIPSYSSQMAFSDEATGGSNTVALFSDLSTDPPCLFVARVNGTTVAQPSVCPFETSNDTTAKLGLSYFPRMIGSEAITLQNQPVFAVTYSPSNNTVSVQGFDELASYLDPATMPECPTGYFPRPLGLSRACHPRAVHVLEVGSGLLDFEVILRQKPGLDIYLSAALAPENIDPTISVADYWKAITAKYGHTYVFLLFADHIDVQAIQLKFCDASSYIFVQIDTIDFPTSLSSFHVMSSSLALLATASQPQWMLESVSATSEICDRLSNDPGNVFLENYRELCDVVDDDAMTSSMEVYPFVYLVSSCMPSLHCPSVISPTIERPAGGMYTLHANRERVCPAGYYCSNGHRTACTQGSICRYVGMSAPESCNTTAFGTTCSSSGLTDISECPTGALCLTSYALPLPVPPGQYLNVSSQTVLDCKLGDYCALGRSTSDYEDLLCPAGVFCPNTTVIEPDYCVVGDYCPAGTVLNTSCPAGSECLTPVNISDCDSSEYCPNGTQIGFPCPAGSFCQYPNVSNPCPQGFYCPEGTVSPIACPAFVRCPEGTERPTGVVVSVVYEVLIVVLFVCFCFIVLWINRYARGRKRTAEYSYISQKRHGAGLVCQNLSISLSSNSKPIIRNFSGRFRSGALTAICGPSGAGKTTLLKKLVDELDRKVYACSSSPFLEGFEGYVGAARREIGFMPQDDILLADLTVEESLQYSAALRLPGKSCSAHYQAVVERTLRVLGLTDIRDVLVGDAEKRGISGGQRKRVSLGLELVSEPSVLLCDEPTSGLDAVSALEVMQCLHRVSELGVTVICVIHQPRFEIFNVLDDLALLTVGGHLAFFGESSNALTHMASLGFECPPYMNPADYLLDVATCRRCASVSEPATPSHLAMQFERYRVERSTSSADIILKQGVMHVRTPASIVYQSYVLLKRTLVITSRQWKTVAVNLSLIAIASLLLGAMINALGDFRGPVPSKLSDMCPEVLQSFCMYPMRDSIGILVAALQMILPFIGTIFGVRIFSNDLLFVARERGSKVSIFGIFISKVIVHIIELLLMPLAMFVGLLYVSGNRWTLSSLYWRCFVSIADYTAIGYIIAIVVPHHNQALASVVIPFVLYLISGSNPLPSVFRDAGIGFVLYFHPGFAMRHGFYLTFLQPYLSIYESMPHFISSLQLYSWDSTRLRWTLGVCFFAYRLIVYILLKFQA